LYDLKCDPWEAIAAGNCNYTALLGTPEYGYHKKTLSGTRERDNNMIGALQLSLLIVACKLAIIHMPAN
jgi:hypothetical protein